MSAKRTKLSHSLGFKILNEEEVQLLIEQIFLNEGLVIEALPKPTIDNQGYIISPQSCQDLLNIIMIGQKALTQFPLTKETLEQLSEPVAMPPHLAKSLKNNKNLNKQMVFLQLPILLEREKSNPKQLAWLKIAIYLNLMMYRLDKTSYYK